MFDIDVIIPCYGESSLIRRNLHSLAAQWHKEFMHVTLVNDCSPNTDCNYQDLVDDFKGDLDIRVIKTPENYGQGLARQYGIDNTKYDYFMFADEDDQYGNALAISIFVGAVEGANIDFNEDGSFTIGSDGKPVLKEGAKPVSIVSGPVFEFDDNHTHVIDNTNRIWVNSKLYSREFCKKHNIRFNKAQSRHAEDYYFMSTFFFCMDHDESYQGILLDNNGIYYLWYPNEKSQSRIDPHYGFMLSGYTMDGSVNILKFMKDTETNGIVWNDKTEEEYNEKVLNMTMYSFFTFLSFIRRVASTDYVPKLEQDWYLLRDACNELRKMTKERFANYSYSKKNEEYYVVKNMTDVQFTEPWISFDEYIQNGCEQFEWDYETLLKCKETMKFDENGVRIYGGVNQ